MSAHVGEDGYTKSLLVGFWAALIVNVVSQGIGVSLISMATKPFIMLLLFCWAWQVLPRPRPKAGSYLLVGMLFALLGDIFLMFATRDAQGNIFFLAGIGGFLVMQIFYILAFLAVPGVHMLKKAPLLLIPFVVYWGGMNALLQPGRMRIPVLIYSIVLVGMSVAALDLVPRLPSPLGWRVFIGSVIFVVSDSLIALNAFGDLQVGNWQGVLVMSTYGVAQYLIVTGLCRGLRILRDQESQELAPPQTRAAAPA